MKKQYDWILLVAVGLLTVIGLVVLHAINLRDPGLAQGFDPTQQIVSALLGVAALIAAARTDYRLWLRTAPVWYLVSIILLVMILFVGEAVSGAVRSITIGFFEFQPTEIAKLGLIFMTARLYTRHAQELSHPKYLLLSLGVFAVLAALVLQQPDLGSTVVLGFIWCMMTLVSRVPKGHFLVLLIIAAIAAPFMFAQLEPYQQTRIQTFFDPTADPQGDGYNVNQSMIAVGSGQLLGRGLSGGTQSQLNFLPAQHTDFIFAVLAEKLGLVGAGVVLGLFMVVFWRALKIAWNAYDHFGNLIATGITALLLIHVVITVGMNLGVAPVTGLPLPFIAYGGTNLIMSLFAIGVLQSIAAHNKELQFRS